MAENQESTATPAAEASAPAGGEQSAAAAPRAEKASGESPAPCPPKPAGERRPRQGGPGGKRFFRRRKVDFFSVNKIDDINYKDIENLKQFLGDRGKILPRRHTGLSSHHQRQLRQAVKRARNIALLPFAGEIKKGKQG